MGECLYEIFIICLKNFYEIFYVFIWVKEGGGGSLMLVYVWEHIAFPTEQIDGY